MQIKPTQPLHRAAQNLTFHYNCFDSYLTNANGKFALQLIIIIIIIMILIIFIILYYYFVISIIIYLRIIF